MPGLRFGWASFPEDGVTLDVLLGRAAADAQARPKLRRSRGRWAPEPAALGGTALAGATDRGARMDVR
jgi:hypothetical protein